MAAPYGGRCMQQRSYTPSLLAHRPAMHLRVTRCLGQRLSPRLESCRPSPFGLQPPSLANRFISKAVEALQEATQTPPINEEVKQSTAYPFTDIENKWQAYWETHKTFRTPEDVDTSKPKYYVLDMFPYPR
jgi:hypothetical protein